MNTPTVTRATPHPLVIIASIAVTLFSAAGIAAIMGWVPTSRSDDAARLLTSEAPKPAPATTAPPATPQPQVAPAPAPRPVARTEAPAPRPTAVARNEAPTTAPQGEPAPQPQPAPRAACLDCGTITAVRQVTRAGDGSGAGAVAGGVVGGVLGHQVGNGRGRDVATVVGAIGGAVAGHQVEKHVRRTTTWMVDVRMDDGTTRSFAHEAQPAWRSGERVHTEGGVLRAAG